MIEVVLTGVYFYVALSAKITCRKGPIITERLYIDVKNCGRFNLCQAKPESNWSQYFRYLSLCGEGTFLYNNINEPSTAISVSL